jgi:hypothetical protein
VKPIKKPDVTNEGPKYWEGVLASHRQNKPELDLGDASNENAIVVVPQLTHKKSGNNPDFERLREKFDSDEGFVDGHQIEKIRTREKNIPSWATNNSEVQKILLSAFPKLKNNKIQRKRASRWAAVIHLFYRMNMTKSQVAHELKTKTTIVNRLLQRIRCVGDGTTEYAQGKKRK